MKKRIVGYLLLLLSSCVYTEKVRDGKTAFERKQYKVALPMLEKSYKKAESKAQKGKIAYMIAESYTLSGQSSKAVEWYKIAYDNQAGVEALRKYANGLKQNEQYEQAIAAYKELGMELGSSFEVKRDIQACQTALIWLSPKVRSPYLVEQAAFNSPFDDYAPAHYTADQLVITSDRPNPDSPKNYKWTGRAFSDLLLIDKTNNTVKNFGAQINTLSNEGCATFSSDFNMMVFTRSVAETKNGDEYMKLMYARRSGVLWSEPEEIAFCKEKVNYWHPFLSADNTKLFFAANDPDGWGGFDLYVSAINPNGEFGNPTLLPRTINTIGDEVFPTLDKDTLYFSSNYHQGMGGLDIFKTILLNANTWTTPQNLKSPINSGADDFALLVDNTNIKSNDVLQTGYFTSNRKGGLGGDDIYTFKKINLPKLPEDTILKPKKDIVYEMILDGYVVEKIFQQADNPNAKVIGRKPLANANVNITFGKDKKVITTNDEGYFSLNLSENTDYSFVAQKENYLNNSAKFSTKGIAKDPNNPSQRFDIEIVLDKIYKNREITLENIYYDFDKADIRDDAKPTLHLLAKLLQENPKIKIQLSSHTDCKGNDKYNEDLSQRRAQSAVDYLIGLGIESNRLTAKGFGETQPEVNCECNKCSDAELQANRRTTFKIVD